jgi:hypothetical protein
LLWLLRIALYVQLALGLVQLAPRLGLGSGLPRNVWELHLGLGILIALLAIVALRPRPLASVTAPTTAARFLPLLPLALGLAFTAGVAPRSTELVVVHALLGLAAIALVELAAARQRRARPA